MSLYILDTDTLSLLQRGHTQVLNQVTDHLADDLAITIITVEECLSGWYALLRRAKTPERLANVYGKMTESMELMGCFEMLPLTNWPLPATEHCDRKS